MEDVLVRGQFQGLKRKAGVLCGEVEVNWVYNSMPPAPGQIYRLYLWETSKNF